jgi:WD40 repeat protein
MLTEFLAPPQARDELGRLGGFRILKILGHGGMGVVFQGEDPRLGRPVAIKAMLPHLAGSSSSQERFLREARAAAALEHDHIVPILQVGEDRGAPFIVMPLLKGESLEDRLRRDKQVPIAEVLRIGRETAEGLAAAHERGLIHRDIKPANIWLEGGRGRVKILDFGLARAATQESGLTQQGAVIGTPAYMAPEQGRGEAVDARCDLFSLGVVLYRMGTGQPPFRGNDIVATLMAVALDEPPPPQSLRPDLPPELSDLVMRLLAKNPAQRPASAREVVKVLGAIQKAPLASRPGAALRPAVPGAGQDTVAESEVSRPSDRPRLAKRSLLPWAIGAGALAVVFVAFFLLFRPSANTTNGNGGKTKDGGGGGIAQEESSPLSPLALVQRPPKIKGVESWTIESRGHRGMASHLVLDYNADGTRFATGGTDGMVRLWQAATGQLQRILVGHEQRVTILAWSPGDKILASGSDDTTVRLWDPTTGKLLATLRKHTEPITALAWSRDGNALASGSEDKLVLLWNPATGETSTRFDRHQAAITDVGWPSDRTLVSLDRSDTLMLWDAGTGQVRQTFPVSPPRSWSADHQVLVYKSGGKDVKFWGPEGEKTRSLTLKEQEGDLASLALSPDGKTLATQAGRSVYCWDAVSGQLRFARKGVVKSAQVRLQFSPNGAMFLSADHGIGLTLRVWPVAALQANATLNPQEVWDSWMGYRAVGKWSPDSRTFVVPRSPTTQGGAVWGGTPDGWVLLDPSGKFLRHLLATVHSEGDVVWSPDGTRLAVGHPFRKVRVQEADSGEVVCVADEEPRDNFLGIGDSHLDWSRNGILAIYQGSHFDTKAVHLFDAQTGARLKEGLKGPVSSAAAWSPDGQKLATIHDGNFHLHDAVNGKGITRHSLPALPDQALAWSPTSEVLATGGKSIKLWKADTGADLPPVFPEPGPMIRAVAWSPDGQLLAGGDVAGVIRLYNARTGKVVRTWEGGHNGPIHTLAWMSDSKSLLSLDEKEGKVCSWEVGADKLVRVTSNLPRSGRFSPDRKLLVSHHDQRGVHLWEVDTGRLRGTLLTIPDRENLYLTVSADGHFRFNGDAERHVVYVVRTADGQETFTPGEFKKKFGWENVPKKVRLTSSE